ncbi:MAG: T9SS type A sorting domain-containing protein [Saprospiraceae bacterium]|nr:T9SS type A sorting domain-containing protein [Saprospiraceae bacterium]
MKMTATLFKHSLQRISLSILLTASLAYLAVGQTCNFTIQMYDTFGDGWNDGVLTVVSNGNTTTHTLIDGDQGTSTFQVTAGQPVTLSWTPGFFPGEPYFELLDPDGIPIFTIDPTIPSGLLFSFTGFCPNCPSLNPNSITIVQNQVTDSSAFVNWPNQPGVAEYWMVEFGPAGFPLGTGISFQTTASQATLQGLNPCVDYDVYISTFCGVDSLSNPSGPKNFTTKYTPNPPGTATCEYTFNLFDAFGDGWDNGALEVKHNGVTSIYTLPDGSQGSFTLTATSNVIIGVSYLPSFYPIEVSYEVVDPNGEVIFADGPNPAEGLVFTTIACPSCAEPRNAWMSDVNATNARLAWTPAIGAIGNYIIEYGPMAFTRGNGTVLTVPSGQLSYVQLPGLSENTWYNAYIVLDCGTEFSKPIGPLVFKTLWMDDLGVSGITMPNAGDCNLSENQEIEVLLTNYGQAPQTLFEFYYAVNGVPASIPTPQDGLFTGVLGNDSTQVIQFETTWDFSIPGIYQIQAWTALNGDNQIKNDTFTTTIVTAYPKPLKEDFEDSLIPETWISDGLIYGPFAHNNPTRVWGSNLYAGNNYTALTTYRVGPIGLGDSLTFDYRFVAFDDPETGIQLGAGDKLEVQISDDCEATWETVLTIDPSNHVPDSAFASRKVLLSPYAGTAINIRFLGTWGNGDYWLDLDNININGCPTQLYIVGDVQGTLDGDSTGIINLALPYDQGSFTYEWQDGAGTAISNEQDLSSLPLGTYTVTVTSSFGCTGTKVFNIGIFVATDEGEGVEQISLYPNPTSGEAFVEVKLMKNMDVELRLFSMSGQLVFASQQENTTGFNQMLDLSGHAPGMYFLQIIADGKPYHAKLVVAK